MSDSAIQGYIQTLIQAVTGFDDDDVTKGDPRVIDSGSPPYAIVWPGTIFEASRSGDWSQVQITWRHAVHVVERLLDDDYGDFCTYRQGVIDAIGQNPTLGGNSEIVNTLVVEASLEFVRARDASPDAPAQFVMSDLTVETTERITYDGDGEFA